MAKEKERKKNKKENENKNNKQGITPSLPLKKIKKITA